jgi:hypothetical protein
MALHERGRRKGCRQAIFPPMEIVLTRRLFNRCAECGVPPVKLREGNTFSMVSKNSFEAFSDVGVGLLVTVQGVPVERISRRVTNFIGRGEARNTTRRNA